MKKFFSMMLVMASVMFVFTSCSVTSYMQIADVKSSTLKEQGDNYVYSDENCKITYNFWSNAGEVSFYVENLTDKILYIDLGKSFFTRNGGAYDYFLNRTFESGKYNEKEILAIPPHSMKNIAEYDIVGDVIQDCSVALFPKKRKPQSITYGEDESPVKFSNYITYKVGENGSLKSLTHDFYVSGYTNYVLSVTQELVKVGCKKQRTVTVNKYGKATKYYYIYTKQHDNSNSADARVQPEYQ